MKLFHVSRDSFVKPGVVATAIICAESHERAIRHWPLIDTAMQLEVVEIAPAPESQLPGVLMSTEFWGQGRPGSLSTKHSERKIFIVCVERGEETKLKVTPLEQYRGAHPDHVFSGIDPDTQMPEM